MVELTRDEQDYVVNVLRSAHTELLRNLHHADSRDFRQTLRTVIELNERIIGKVSETMPAVLDHADWATQPAEQ